MAFRRTLLLDYTVTILLRLPATN